MNYKKVTITLTPYSETAIDILTAQMGEIGFDSFEETDNGVIGYAMENNFDADKLTGLTPLIDNIKMQYTIDTIPDEDWNKEWEENYFKPIVIGGKCRIRSPFHETDKNIPYEIIINPQMSFGTGYHETTTMMIEYLLEKEIANKDVLDMGCGTGILGIMASMRGAKTVDCIDIDEWCYKNTIENAQLNNRTNITTIHGGAEVLSNKHYDIIIANINRNILIENLAKYATVLKKGGTMMLSGFYTADSEAIVAEAKRLGLRLVETKVMNDWNGLLLNS